MYRDDDRKRELMCSEDILHYVKTQIDRDMSILKDHSVYTDTSRDLRECITTRLQAMLEVKSYIERGNFGA